MAQDEDKDPSKLDDKKLLIRIRERFKLMEEADRENRTAAKEDIRFVSVPGAQWDDKVRKARNGRPCYEFDKVSVKGQRLINEMRANRPAGKVRAVEDSDKKTADVREGMCRNIANVSDLDTICDYAGVYQVEGGMGAWRVTTEYARNSRRKQRIRAEPIANPFCLYWDPAAVDPLKRDAQDWCLIDRMSKSAFAAKYGKKAHKVSFEEGDHPAGDDWEDEETVRVCEYWYKETYEKEIWILQDGREIDSTSRNAKKIDQALIAERDTIECDHIMMCIASGDAIVEKPTVQAGTQHRFIVVHGAWKMVEEAGKARPMWWGLVRKAKDAQRSYNVERTSFTETVASIPNSQFWATPAQAQGHTDTWDRALTENLPYLLANADPKQPGFPQRMGSAEVPVAFLQALQLADQELKDVTGVYDASLGERSNETSGRAIDRREQQTQLVNFNFPDNMAKGVQRTWEIFNDLIPEIYDTEQMVRVLGHDLAEEYVKVNTVGVDQETGQPIIVNDMTTGEYDITVTVGPSFATQRMEAADTLTEMAKSDPALMITAPDLVYKAMDMPYSDEIAERRRLMLPPPIQKHLDQGKKLPPEVQNALAQVEEGKQMVQQHGQLVQAAQQELEQTKAEAEKSQAQVQTAIEKLKTEEARFEAQVAKAMAGLAQKEAQLAEREVQSQLIPHQQSIEAERSNLTNEAQQAVQTIQQLAEQFMQNAAQIVQQIDQRAATPAAPTPTRRRTVRMKRVNGELTGTVDEVDDMGAVVSSRPASISRQNGELVGSLQ
jgi:hypothetical protein